MLLPYSALQYMDTPASTDLFHMSDRSPAWDSPASPPVIGCCSVKSSLSFMWTVFLKYSVGAVAPFTFKIYPQWPCHSSWPCHGLDPIHLTVCMHDCSFADACITTLLSYIPQWVMRALRRTQGEHLLKQVVRGGKAVQLMHTLPS